MKPSDGYVAYIVNPKSGTDSKKTLVSRFEEYLRTNGFDVRTNHSKSMADICELATKAALDDNCKIVIVAGGDGTVREAANGLEGSGKELMIIPSGNENLLATELGLDEKITHLKKVFEEGHVRMLDLVTRWDNH